MAEPAIVTSGLVKVYPGLPPTEALRGIDISVDRGERVAILGRSGAGKSTLLNLLGLLDTPTSGVYRLLGRETTQFRSRARNRARATDLGFVFQAYHVLAHRTVAENVLLKLTTGRVRTELRSELVGRVIADVGLEERHNALGQTLSGGEKQRVAIARAIVTAPPVLLADEPTGNLDRANADGVLALFDAQADRGVAVVVITHDDRTAAWADRIIEIEDGRAVGP